MIDKNIENIKWSSGTKDFLDNLKVTLPKEELKKDKPSSKDVHKKEIPDIKMEVRNLRESDAEEVVKTAFQNSFSLNTLTQEDLIELMHFHAGKLYMSEHFKWNVQQGIKEIRRSDLLNRLIYHIEINCLYEFTKLIFIDTTLRGKFNYVGKVITYEEPED